MGKKVDITDVFNGLGTPTKTYVAQDKGKYEQLLKQGIKEKGTLCLITGSSKTGKTTLYKKVLSSLGKTPLVVRCDASLDSNDFWKSPLEEIDFSRLKEVSCTNGNEVEGSAKIGGNIGWGWLAGLIGEVSLGVKSGQSESEIRERIVSKPSPKHLIPLLHNTNAVLVVEDFHYLNEKEQKNIFQQWKSFTDGKVSVIVVGTTHHGVDLAYANSDLIGRIQQIDLKRWEHHDLKEIALKGFEVLKIEPSATPIGVISKESAGLPIITQQACAQLFMDQGLFSVSSGTEITFTRQQAFDALHNVAVNRYKQFEQWYTRLTTGPRIKARKYNTYELVLTAFSLDPLKFDLKRHEIDERLTKIGLESSEVPPPASVNSTLSALAKFQSRSGFELLEWSKKDQALYVVEPAFLFYLRWREARTSFPTLTEFINMFFEARSQNK